jgi:hypothetical protein
MSTFEKRWSQNVRYAKITKSIGLPTTMMDRNAAGHKPPSKNRTRNRIEKAN